MFYSEELLISGDKSFTPVRFDNDGIFKVPAGNTKIKIDCYGGQGYSVNSSNARGGLGGYVSCILKVTPKQTLYIKVGKQNPYNASNNASAVYTNSSNWINSCLVVAGGGGGGYGYGAYATGGEGGGLIGGDAPYNGPGSYSVTPCTGGNTINQVGGTGGSATYLQVNRGANGSKGAGGGPAPSNQYIGYGGQGYYGGGGGAYAGVFAFDGVSSAGGSSYTDSTLCTNVVHQQGVRAGNGYVIISMA